MPILSKLLISRSGPTALNALKAIQTNCKIYNYDISKLNLKPVYDRPWKSQNPIFNIQQVGNLNTGSVTIQGDQIG
jgi:hypothetical protein